jgi:hypothetical protein
MNRPPHLLFKAAAARIRGVAFGVILGACVIGGYDPAFAQTPPPLGPPVVGPLPDGLGVPSIGPFLLTPTLDLSTFYDSNIHGNPTSPLSGPGFDIHPALTAEYNAGLYDTRLYGNIDSDIYPTLNYVNNTFNRQAGIVQTYSPLRDLTFTVQGDYTHATLAPTVINSIPTPLVSPGTPPLTGSAAVAGIQQTVVNPNDSFTVTGSMYKQFNSAFLSLGTSLVRTEYEVAPTQDYDTGSFNAGGGIWFTPQFYAFANAQDANTVPSVGSIANSYSARGGIGSAQIGLLQGSVYYGHQGTAVADNGGNAGGDIYGGLLTYFATEQWKMSVAIDRIRNLSDIAAGVTQGLAGVQLSAVAIPTTQSAQITSATYRTDYTLSPQTSAYFALNDTRTSDFGMPLVTNSWLASTGVKHQIRDNLSVSFDYSYTHYLSPTPGTSFTRNLVTLGAHYRY